MSEITRVYVCESCGVLRAGDTYTGREPCGVVRHFASTYDRESYDEPCEGRLVPFDIRRVLPPEDQEPE